MVHLTASKTDFADEEPLGAWHELELDESAAPRMQVHGEYGDAGSNGTDEFGFLLVGFVRFAIAGEPGPYPGERFDPFVRSIRHVHRAIFKLTDPGKLEDYLDRIEVAPADPIGRTRRFEPVGILPDHPVR